MSVETKGPITAQTFGQTSNAQATERFYFRVAGNMSPARGRVDWEAYTNAGVLHASGGASINGLANGAQIGDSYDGTPASLQPGSYKLTFSGNTGGGIVIIYGNANPAAAFNGSGHAEASEILTGA